MLFEQPATQIELEDKYSFVNCKILKDIQSLIAMF